MGSPVSLRAVLSACIVFLLFAGIYTAGCTDPPGFPASRSPAAENTTDLRVYFLDVGQGDSSLILFRDKVILIDAGEVDLGDRVVRDIRKTGADHIDLLVATHPHSDHIGGMQKVLANFPVEKVLDSGLISTSPLYAQFLRTVDRKKIPYMIAEQGQTIDIDPAIRILVLSPPKERIGDDLNTNSIVLRVSSGTLNLLYSGDTTTAAEEIMEKAGYPLDAQILKVGHHASYSSSSAAFIARVRPDIAVISLGTDNPYGYPHREPLQRLQNAGVVIYRTDRNGTILIRSNGAAYSVVTENEGGDIWSYSGKIPATSGTTILPVSAVTAGTNTASAIFTLPVPLPTIPSNVTEPSLSHPPFPEGNASAVYISAVQFDAPGDDTKNLNGEWVRVTNRGDGAALLDGWTMSDRTGAEPYRFSSFHLQPGCSVTIYTGSGEMNDTSLYRGMSKPLWGNRGDEATLRDGGGNIIDRRSEENSS